MSTTITGVTLTQAGTGGSTKITVAATVTDSDNANLALAYSWKLTSDSVYTKATVAGPANIAATSGGAALSAVWDIDSDYSGSLTTASVDFKITATKTAAASTGALTIPAANATTGIKDGDTLTILGTTYEFSTDGTPQAGNTAVTITATSTAAQVTTALISALNALTGRKVSAVANGATGITLTDLTAGVAGNVAITSVHANAGGAITATGMTGGYDAASVSTSATDATAATGSVSPLPTSVTNPWANLPNSKFVYVFEQEGKHGLGEMTTDFLKGAVLYSAIDALKAGKYQKFDYVNDRSVAMTKRAALISTTEFARITAGQTIPVALKSKQWLAYKAWRAFSRVFAVQTTVYAITEDVYDTTTATKTVTKHVVAYLLSYAYYNALAH